MPPPTLSIDYSLAKLPLMVLPVTVTVVRTCRVAAHTPADASEVAADDAV